MGLVCRFLGPMPNMSMRVSEFCNDCTTLALWDIYEPSSGFLLGLSYGTWPDGFWRDFGETQQACWHVCGWHQTRHVALLALLVLDKVHAV